MQLLDFKYCEVFWNFPDGKLLSRVMDPNPGRFDQNQNIKIIYFPQPIRVTICTFRNFYRCLIIKYRFQNLVMNNVARCKVYEVTYIVNFCNL